MSPEHWSEIYLGAFLIGLLAPLALLFLGAGHHGGADGGHGGADTGHGVGAEPGDGMHGAFQAITHFVVPVLNLFSLLAFLLCGGAAGYVALRLGAGPLSSKAWALGAGCVGAWGMAGVIRLLERAEAGVVRPVDPAGTVACVSAAIRPGVVGEILFRRDGKREALPARADDPAQRIELDDEVVVMRIEEGVAYVRRSRELLS